MAIGSVKWHPYCRMIVGWINQQHKYMMIGRLVASIPSSMLPNMDSIKN